MNQEEYMIKYVKQSERTIMAQQKVEKPELHAIWRVVRYLVALILAGAAAKYADNVYWLSLAALIGGLSKYLRDKYGIDLYLV